MAIMNEQRTEQGELRALLALLQDGIPSQTGNLSELMDAFEKTALQLLIKLQKAAVERLAGAGLGTIDRERLIVYARRQVISEWRDIAPLVDHFLRPTPDFEETEGGTTVRISVISTGKPAQQNASPSGAKLVATIGKLLLLAKRILSVPIAPGESALNKSPVMDIAVVMGDSFSLRRVPWFRQAMILTMPVYTLSQGQEIHILWHELASLFVGRERVYHLARRANDASCLPHRIFPTLSTPAQGIDWAASSPADAPTAEVYTQAKAASRPDADDQGWDVFWMYWAHKLHGADSDLTLHSKPTCEALEALDYLEDWRVAHLEELVEDACVTLVFKEAHYPTLKAMFTLLHEEPDWTRPDFRHPAPALRLGVTLHLLHRMGAIDSDALSADEYAAQPGAALLAGWIYDNRALFFTENAAAFASLQTLTEALNTNLPPLRKSTRHTEGTDIEEDRNSEALSVEQYLWMHFSYLDPSAETPAPRRPKPPMPNKPR